MSTADQQKAAAAEIAVGEVREEMIVGLGTGSTAAFVVEALARRVAAGLRVTGIPTSETTEALARRLGIPLGELAEDTVIDVTLDGADEVERGSLALIKGRGGALLREKIVASASRRLVIVIDRAKWVDRLGEREPVPIEVVPFGWPATAAKLRRLGCVPVLRRKGDQPFVTDGGHHILDCRFAGIPDPAGLAQALDAVVGVVEHGLFVGMTARVVEG